MSDATVALRSARRDARAAGPGTGGPERGARPGSTGLIRLLPMAPAVVVMAIFFIGPVAWACYVSLTNRALTGIDSFSPSFVGLQNYAQLFAPGGGIVSAIGLTVLFTACCVVIQNVAGMILALLMRRRNRVVRGSVATVVVAAWIVPEVVAGFVWYSFLQPHSTLNAFLGAAGLPAQNWLVTLPMLAVILANGWRGTAFSMMIYSAAVSDIPPDLIEAASVDGAGGVQRLRHVIIPSLRRIIGTNALLTTLQTLGVFTLIYTMTGGGPNNKSETLPLLMYDQAFNFNKIGAGNAIAVILLAVGAVLSVIYLSVLKPGRT